MVENYDFSGWATKNDIRCTDGRTIRQDAFKDNDGQIVPLVWGHVHDDPTNVLGHALLVNKPEGVRAYGKFNDTEKAQHAKSAVMNRDVTSLSIYANKLKQKGGDVLHGDIKEVSLVLAGANIGAFIDVPYIEHGDDNDPFEAVIYSGEEIELVHSEEASEETEEPEETEELEHAEPEEKEEKEDMAENKEKTVKDVIDSMTDEQKEVLYYMVGEALDEGNDDVENEDGDNEEVEHSEEGEREEMAYNVFDEESRRSNVLSHDDMMNIVELAKTPQVGSFQTALDIFAEENGMELQHDAVSSGFIQTPVQTGDLTVEALFPEYKDVRPGAPELITNDQGWISVVLAKVHKSPISRIRTGQVDIRNIEGSMDSLRGRGYQKGKQKSQTGNFKLVRRTTDPQTIYVKSALHRDDIVDITDFDYVQYLYNIDRMQLNEELATAILFGDGRDDASPDKIFPEHIRPIWTDDNLYTIHYDIDVEAARNELQGTDTNQYFGDNYVRAEAMINACLYSREQYKGSGTPDMFIHPHELNVMLLARDRNGRRIYNSKAELASAFNVGNIYTVEQMINKTRTEGEGQEAKTKKLLALIGNLSDYSLGATKGGEITHFTQFDIDFNQQKSLIETRCSGALTRVWSAIAIEEDITA
jgi:hypothetical protein